MRLYDMSVPLLFVVVVNMGTAVTDFVHDHLPLKEEKPPVCLKWYPVEVKNCIKAEVPPEADPERMRYVFERNKWNRYSSIKSR